MALTEPEQLEFFSTSGPGGAQRQGGRPEVEPPDLSGRGFYDYTVGLVACSKSKAAAPVPARDLYTGTLFKRARAYCERVCGRWYILSAEHGLVHPEQVIAPYEKTLKTASALEREAWGQRVLEQLRVGLGAERVWHFVFLAGRDYRENLPLELFALGVHSLPLKGCAGLGEQVSRLGRLVAQWDSWRETEADSSGLRQLEDGAIARLCGLHMPWPGAAL